MKDINTEKKQYSPCDGFSIQCYSIFLYTISIFLYTISIFLYTISYISLYYFCRKDLIFPCVFFFYGILEDIPIEKT